MVPRSGTAAASKRGNRILRPDRHRLSGRRRIFAETSRQCGNSDVTNNLVAGPKLAQGRQKRRELSPAAILCTI